MIIITGAAGFIGSQVAEHFSRKLSTSVLAIDNMEYFTSRTHLSKIKSIEKLGIEGDVFGQLAKFDNIQCFFHMGAISATDAKDPAQLKKWNVEFSKSVWKFCISKNIPLIYASSAATYGDGTLGFNDSHSKFPDLMPLNLYGQSKHEFDLFALEQKDFPESWYGLKFFNVFGPNEDHKTRQASVAWHGYHEIRKTGQMTLFKSHNEKYRDGEQRRDFVYVKDCLMIMEFLLSKRPENGIYNCGSGKASTFLELASALFQAMEKPEKINFVPTPEAFRAGYQYNTCADMTKIREVGYTTVSTPLTKSVYEYVEHLSRI